ncbi:hypothetical protein E2562_005648 [Oryza meyeriana var. granulata]|uniref:Uncharacterized protein n=1 Tax=Oryza meyeriana var. granulata TaxID=110450 RepID=A0A6G1BJH7_9ORYZ|nr:hypothetical protein E2562_005648 [Oryza meyeriana var. granulata]
MEQKLHVQGSVRVDPVLVGWLAAEWDRLGDWLTSVLVARDPACRVGYYARRLGTYFNPIKWVEVPAAAFLTTLLYDNVICMYKITDIARDDTADSVFVFFGRIAQRLVQKPVEALIEQISEGTTYGNVPRRFSEFIGHDITWINQCTLITTERGRSAQTSPAVKKFDENKGNEKGATDRGLSYISRRQDYMIGISVGLDQLTFLLELRVTVRTVSFLVM